MIDHLEEMVAAQQRMDGQMNKLMLNLQRPLGIEDVQFMVNHEFNGMCRILAYKNARVDMRRLDEVVSPGGWQREHKCVDGHWFCRVGIRIGGEWVWKEDAGAESTYAAEKGAASDSFKRACFNWGIGRELYEYPDIEIAGTAKTLNPQYWDWDAGYDDDGRPVWLRAMKGSKVMFAWPHDDLPVTVYEHTEAVRRLWYPLTEMKSAHEEADWATMAEYWDAISAEDKRLLWLAPTKGGVFSTAERDELLGDNVAKARKELRSLRSKKVPEKHTAELIE